MAYSTQGVELMPGPALQRGWTRPTAFSGVMPAISAEQFLMFPRKTVWEQPPPSGCDIYAMGMIDDGTRYYLKTDWSSERPTRANEWIAAEIARSVGIATPNSAIVQAMNGDLLFGSEAIDSVSTQADTVNFLETSSMNEVGVPIMGLQSALTATHVLDLFLNNIDRHPGNFLVKPRGNEHTLYAIDHARCLFFEWPLQGFQMGDTETNRAWIALRERHGFDRAIADIVASRIGAITFEQMEAILRQMPTHWLHLEFRESLLAYCVNGGWTARVDALREGLRDGSLI